MHVFHVVMHLFHDTVGNASSLQELYYVIMKVTCLDMHDIENGPLFAPREVTESRTRRSLEEDLDHEVEAAGQGRPAPAHPGAGGGIEQPPPASEQPPPPETALSKREPSEVPLSQLPTSKTHKRQWSCLDRVATGPRAKAHPSLTALWNGSSEDKRRALYQYLQNEENLAATEAAMQVTRRKTDSMTHSRRWMTLKQMHEEKFSECLARS